MRDVTLPIPKRKSKLEARGFGFFPLVVPDLGLFGDVLDRLYEKYSTQSAGCMRVKSKTQALKRYLLF